MIKSLAFFLLLVPAGIWCQDQPVTITTRQDASGKIAFDASNTSFAPYTAVLTITGKNIIPDDESPLSVVVPAQTSDFTLTYIDLIPGQEVSYSFEYLFYLGDTKHARHDDEFIYELPFQQGKSYPVGQGYFGRFSHVGKKAVDFDMPEGTPVCAARSGVVVRVKEDSDSGCRSEHCQDDANLITILHDDGTFAEYVHLEKNGSAVALGDSVKIGNIIGYSGQTGWASGPHLHFEVFQPSEEGRLTVSTKFNAKSGVVDKLQEGKSYQR